MRKGNSNIPPAQQAEIDALAALPEEQINTNAIPEQRDWTDAQRGAFFRPVKKQLTLRLDADVIDWFKAHAAGAEGYQTSMNRALRAHMQQHGSK